MLRLTEQQRALLAEKLMDTANTAAGALIFGQAFSDRVSVPLMVLGIAAWMMFAGFATAIAGVQNDAV